ncbi:MAG: hypothetical protein ACE5OZ_19370 [Candidatus Heimdallarchaeota archaeon]
MPILFENCRELEKTKRIFEIDLDPEMTGADAIDYLQEQLELDFEPFLWREGFEPVTSKFSQSLPGDLFNNGPVKILRTLGLEEVRQLQTPSLATLKEDFPFGVFSVEDRQPEEVRQRMADTIVSFLLQAMEDPASASFKIPSRTNDNIGYDEKSRMVLIGNLQSIRTFRDLASYKTVERFAEVMRLVDDKLRRLIHVTKRDLYYENVKLFNKSQGTSDALIEDLGAMLGVTRNSLNINASAKGKVIGRLQFTERGDPIDCTKGVGGHSITPADNLIDNFESDAEFVLVIEKDAVFQRLAEDRFFEFYPSILVTASGQPDMATRRFIKRLKEELGLPCLAIMDADLYGLEILRVYSVGSKSLGFETAEMAVPDIKWLGVRLSDVLEFGIPRDGLLDMTPGDFRRGDLMLREEFIKARPKWANEINIMLGKEGDKAVQKKKAEIQILNSKDAQFITFEYLPDKISAGDWI